MRRGKLVEAILVGVAVLLIAGGQWPLVLTLAMMVLIGRTMAQLLEHRLAVVAAGDPRERAASCAERR